MARKTVSAEEMQLLAGVTESAAALASSIPLTKNLRGSGKLYEAWLMLEMGLAFKNRGWTVKWSDPACFGTTSLPSKIIFRGGPAPMCGKRYKDPPGFLTIECSPDLAFEMHNSVQYWGRSGSLHEIDISILPSVDAQAIREDGGGMPNYLPRVALELKNYTNADFSIGIIRQLLMTAFDVAHYRQIVSKSAHAVMGWWNGNDVFHPQVKRFGYVAAVTSAAAIGNSRQLATHYGADVWKDIVPDPRSEPGEHDDVVALVMKAETYMGY